MIRQWDALIIGAGPAGLRAASVVAESGLEAVLVDEQPFPGGQIYRHVTAPGAKDRFAEAADYRDGTELVRRFERSGAHYLPESTVWFLEPGRALASRGEETLDLRAKNIIVAVGAMERPVPFRGWTLPGVMNAGGGDILLKTAGVLPETPVVLAGSGPLLYLVASHLIRKGHPLAAVLDQTPPRNMVRALPHLPAGLLGLPLLLRGASMLNAVRASKTPVYRDVSRIEAQGTDRLERVSFVAGGVSHTLEAATLLYHGGVIPRTHMANALDLPHRWDPRQQCWTVACDGWGRTEREGVYVAGDCARVRGAAVAGLTGELAGLAVAARQGALGPEEFRKRSRGPKRELAVQTASKAFLDAWFAPRKDLYAVPDDVVICRCEDVRAADIREAVADGLAEVNEIKLRTRAGMGNCQGRTCGPALAAIAAEAAGKAIPDMGRLHVRAPLRPVPLAALRRLLETK